MASSDNVIRAGLTPKFKDIDTLMKALDFNSYTAEDVKMKAVYMNDWSTRYSPPIPEFQVIRVSVSIQ